jgi:ribosomal protein eL43
MPEETKMYGSVKRYGVRYGTKLKGKIAKIESERHTSTTCPYCHYATAKRLNAGIWVCTKCKSNFTGKAYTPGMQQTSPKEEAPAAPEAPVEEPEEEKEEEYDEEPEEEKTQDESEEQEPEEESEDQANNEEQ